ncbi:class-II fumarase/aspartase family protein [Desulfospira joergensenii]|uniref:class-II fumarase/aspartase family protein n=1 Tax=Desulfospira joergensenii TaxID=53329 RepID=UPI0003B5C7BF|nr:adenylosuccinate lyase family protein [Desulfospira joergensenii]
MSVHMTDTTLFADSVGTREMRDVFDENNMLQSWLNVEVALAKAQSALGVIPADAGDIIAAGADISRIDLDAVKESGRVTGHSLMGLLGEFRKIIDHECARYVHFGATTQDILDTGMMLMVKDGYDIVLAQLTRCMKSLSDIVASHADTVMVGRTHGNHGMPITFGFKAASWLSELGRQKERLTQARSRILAGNLTGAVGTFASWGGKGVDIQAKALKILGLNAPDIVWHSSRDRIAELMSLCAQLAGSSCRIGRNVYHLSRTEFRELEEPSKGKIGSSTMPHKKNPVHSEWIMILERTIRANSSICLEVMGQEDEREAARWKNEWIAIPETFVMLSGILNHLGIILGGLTVKKEQMLKNTGILKGMLSSEKIMFLLEKKFPLPEAHTKVYNASVSAVENNTYLIDELLSDIEISGCFTREELEKELDPAGYVGLSSSIALGVLEKVKGQIEPVD